MFLVRCLQLATTWKTCTPVRVTPDTRESNALVKTFRCYVTSRLNSSKRRQNDITVDYSPFREKVMCFNGVFYADISEDILECASAPCGNGATCNEDINMYTCTCAAGYTGIHCQSMAWGICNIIHVFPVYFLHVVIYFCLANIDECASSPCHMNSTCIDQVNEYSCTCEAGYTGTHCFGMMLFKTLYSAMTGR